MRLLPEYYNLLLQELTELYPVQQEVMTVMKKAGLKLGQGNLHGTGENMWDSVLSLAENEDKLKEVVLSAKEKFPDREVLKKTQAAINNESAFLKEVKYASFVKESSTVGIKTFMVYDDEDREIAGELKKQLIPLQRFSKLINIFDMHKEQISGKNKEEFFLKHLGESEIVLLLLTSDFMGNAENDCYPLAVAAHEMGKRVIPVLLKDCRWKRIEFLGNLVPLPKNGKFVSQSGNEDEALLSIANGVEEVANDIKARGK